MLVDRVPPALHGSAFGLMGLLEKAAATAATSAVVWYEDWRVPYVFVGCVSVVMAVAAKRYLKMRVRAKDGDGEELGYLAIFKRISGEPIFVYLVAQGLFGAIPWDMMSVRG